MASELFSERDGDVVVLTLSNPSKRNALDPLLCRALIRALGELPASAARALVLTGVADGKAFCAGFDLEALPGPGEAPTAADDLFELLLEAVSACPLPIVAALNGPAMGGGCELAAACDLRVAHPATKLGLPPARLGISYAPRGLARMAAICGESRARQLFLTACSVEAPEALTWGLVDYIVPVDQVRSRALGLAQEMAELAPLAVQGMRQTFEALLRRRARLDGYDGARISALRETAWRSADAAEGRLAAGERRKPRFTGR